jgi:hypothetical protein
MALADNWDGDYPVFEKGVRCKGSSFGSADGMRRLSGAGYNVTLATNRKNKKT